MVTPGVTKPKASCSPGPRKAVPVVISRRSSNAPDFPWLETRDDANRPLLGQWMGSVPSIVASIVAMFANGPSIRLLPRLDDDNRFFWTGGKDGVLRFLKCGSCHQLVHPPVPVCPACLGRDLAPEAVSGRGRVHAYTVNHQQWIPGSEPYVIGLVEIVEQPDVRLTTNLVDCESEEGLIGSDVEVTFEQHDEVFLPLFRSVDSSKENNS